MSCCSVSTSEGRGKSAKFRRFPSVTRGRSQEWFDEVTSSRRPGSVGTIRSASAHYLLIPRPTRAEVLAQLPAARARDTKDRKAGLRASAVRYDRESKRLLLELTNGFLFGVPVATLPHLKKATPAQLADVTLSPEGGAIRFDAIDADYSVPGLVLSPLVRAEATRELARVAGSTPSAAKADAARANGAKGGRPRQVAKGVMQKRSIA